jgi:hypothetical protein
MGALLAAWAVPASSVAHAIMPSPFIVARTAHEVFNQALTDFDLLISSVAFLRRDKAGGNS